jgi:valyl-tRNA synthetase
MSELQKLFLLTTRITSITTDFMDELLTRYDASIVEKAWYNSWLEHGYFSPTPDPKSKPFSIVIPPPNVTDILHLGHALNNTIQDIFVRYRRMQGFETEWLPGVDHAGIATEVVVEKELLKGITKESIGREKFIRLAHEWAMEKKDTIIEQLKRLGCSCDWDRTKFTIDPEMSDAVSEAFVRLYEKGWIYKGDYIVNWCPRCETAISDEEVDHKEKDGKLYYIKYPLAGKGSVTVATTRPETMLGDTACAVNPNDKKNAKLIGQTVILPLMEREIPIVADKRVDPEFGTGVVKITPAHDPIDFEIATEHDLPKIVIMNGAGMINENGGKYKGASVFEARAKVLSKLGELGLLEKIESYNHSVGHCHRCNTIIEPLLSKQWFVKQTELAKPATAAVENGEVQFFPERWKGVYLNWMHNVRDWCISRQIWWGHRIPVYYCTACKEEMVSATKPDKCPHCGGTELEQDPDVLDTWFSSWLWPLSTFGWPKETKELKRFYPTSLLVTAPDIIFFWVARMIMAGYEFMGKPPFSKVYLHGIVTDAAGIKMSKSLGNGIDPRDVISEYGTDAMRFSLIATAGEGGDPHIRKNTFEIGRDLTNKIWNAYRLLTLLPDGEPVKGLSDRWILSHLNRLTKDVTQSLDKFRLQEPAMQIHDFFWHKFCDWYLESIKVRGDRGIAFEVLENVLKLLHPFIPFVTEEIWQKMSLEDGSIMMSKWPSVDETQIDTASEKAFELIQSIITACRNTRSDLNVPEKKLFNLLIKSESQHKLIIKENIEYLRALGKIENIEFTQTIPSGCRRMLSKEVDVFIPLSGLVDPEKERKKLELEYAKVKELGKAAKQRLKSPEFLSKAPSDVVERTREKAKTYDQKLQKLESHIKLIEKELSRASSSGKDKDSQ